MGDDSLGVLLRRLRLSADFTLEALSERSGVGVRTISDIERGISLGPQHRTMQLVADALRLDDGVRHALLAAARSGRSRRTSGGHGGAALPRGVTDLAGRRHEMDTPTAEVMSDDIEDATALWQSVLANRRVLVVLDNAATEDQVWAAALRGTAVVPQRTERREEAIEREHDVQAMLDDPDLRVSPHVTNFTRVTGLSAIASSLVALQRWHETVGDSTRALTLLEETMVVSIMIVALRSRAQAFVALGRCDEAAVDVARLIETCGSIDDAASVEWARGLLDRSPSAPEARLRTTPACLPHGARTTVRS